MPMKTSVTKQLQALEWKWHDTEQHSQRKEQIHRKFSSRRGHLRCGLDQWDSPDWITWAGIPENTFVVVCTSGEDILIRRERSSLPECFCLNKLNKNKKQFSLCAPLNSLISVWINELSDFSNVFDSNVSPQLQKHNLICWWCERSEPGTPRWNSTEDEVPSGNQKASL